MSTSEMPSCAVYRLMILLLSLHASMAVRASRSLDFAPTDVELASSLRSRSLLVLQRVSIAVAQPVRPEKLPHKDRRITANRVDFSGKLVAKEMGSKPPNCDAKCDICQPCEAVEVPISNHSVQKVREDSKHPMSSLTAEPDDTNYMPESWRCACGSQYYNP